MLTCFLFDCFVERSKVMCEEECNIKLYKGKNTSCDAIFLPKMSCIKGMVKYTFLPKRREYEACYLHDYISTLFKRYIIIIFQQYSNMYSVQGYNIKVINSNYKITLSSLKRLKIALNDNMEPFQTIVT